MTAELSGESSRSLPLRLTMHCGTGSTISGSVGILDSMTKANAGGFRPSIGDYDSQVPSQAGDIETTQIKTNIRREEAK